jgi:hypothetical protein
LIKIRALNAELASSSVLETAEAHSYANTLAFPHIERADFLSLHGIHFAPRLD